MHREDPPRHTDPPGVDAILARLRDLYGPETVADGRTAHWWVWGVRTGTDLELSLDLTPPQKVDGVIEPCVVWVTRPGELKPERCPIASMKHLDAFLALVSIARRSEAPVHGHVCPGTD